MGNQASVVIVDVYGAVNRMALAFRDAGYDCVRVQSTPQVPPSYESGDTFDAYRDNIVYRGDFADLLARLKAYHPIAVVAGSELGVEFTDRIAEELALPGNGTALSQARRDKYVQIETLRAAGVPATRQLLVTDADQLVRWHEEIGGRVVVKPIRSARNDGVTFCDTPAESAAAYRHLLTRKNVFDVRNEGVVAQEYLRGTEFIVNTVSCRGRHRLTDMWRYTKITVNGIRDRINGMLSVPDDDPRHAVLLDYTYAVLDALGIQYGPLHLEIMITSDGPRLVEAGARLCGADVARYAVLMSGESQMDRTVQAYVAPERFLAEYQGPYAKNNSAAMGFLASPVEGILRGYPLAHLVEELESFAGMKLRIPIGERIVRTVDDDTEPAAVGLVHPDPSVVEQDFATLCYLDGFGFYDVQPG